MRRLPIALAAIALALSVLAPVRAVPPDSSVRYEIRRNGDRIGTHRVTFAHQGERLTVHHEIDIRVTILSLEAYRYTMDSRETWEGPRLLGLAASTDKNGDPLRVFARASHGGIRVRGAVGQHDAPAEAVPSSPQFDVFDQPRTTMIEAEDGRLVHVTVSAPRSERVRAGGHELDARRYDVRGGMDATLWYDATGVLVQKRLTAPDGSQVMTILL